MNKELTASGRTEDKGETEMRVSFTLTPAMSEEVRRIAEMTGFSNPEVFRRAFTLLRIHVDAAADGRQIFMVHPDQPNEKYIITLPFTVRRQATNAER